MTKDVVTIKLQAPITTFGDRLKVLRLMSGNLKITKLDEMIQVASDTTRRIEANKNAKIDVRIALRYADFFGVDIRWLALGEGDVPDADAVHQAAMKSTAKLSNQLSPPQDHPLGPMA